MARKQTLVQLSEELLAELDDLARRQDRSRSYVIREAIEAYLHDDREREIDRQIAEAYRKQPQTYEERWWADERDAPKQP